MSTCLPQRGVDKKRDGDTEGASDHEEDRVSALEAFHEAQKTGAVGKSRVGEEHVCEQYLGVVHRSAAGEQSRACPAGLPGELAPVKIILRDLAATLRTRYPEGIPTTMKYGSIGPGCAGSGD